VAIDSEEKRLEFSKQQGFVAIEFPLEFEVVALGELWATVE
jgi:hypothetical protein